MTILIKYWIYFRTTKHDSISLSKSSNTTNTSSTTTEKVSPLHSPQPQVTSQLPLRRWVICHFSKIIRHYKKLWFDLFQFLYSPLKLDLNTAPQVTSSTPNGSPSTNAGQGNRLQMLKNFFKYVFWAYSVKSEPP